VVLAAGDAAPDASDHSVLQDCTPVRSEERPAAPFPS
jgi:hypothetical protein